MSQIVITRRYGFSEGCELLQMVIWRLFEPILDKEILAKTSKTFSIELGLAQR